MEKLIPLGGIYKGVGGASFCRKCKEFLPHQGEQRCPKCKTRIDWTHKMKLVDGEWIKVELWE